MLAFGRWGVSELFVPVALGAIMCDNPAMHTHGTRGAAGALILPLLAAMLLLNARALQREADRLPFDSPVRAPALRALAPLCRAIAFLRIDLPRNLAEALERRTINE